MDLISIVQTTITVLLAILAGWFRTRQIYQKYISKIRQKTLSLIVKAEKDFASMRHAGTDKFEFVVESIYKVVPRRIHWLISKDVIESIVQKTFDEMKKYALEQLDQKLLKEADDSVKIYVWN